MLKLKIQRLMKRHAIFGTFYTTVLREAYRILETETEVSNTVLKRARKQLMLRVASDSHLFEMSSATGISPSSLADIPQPTSTWPLSIRRGSSHQR